MSDDNAQLPRVFTNVTPALLTERSIFIRNAGASGAVVKAFNGLTPEGNEMWLARGLTGNIGGTVQQDPVDEFNASMFPVGRFSNIDDAKPMGIAFAQTGSIAVIGNFRIAKSEVDSLGKAMVPLDATGMARVLMESAAKFPARLPGQEIAALTIECRGITDRYANPG